MNRQQLYHKTVNILFDAYFNDTLRHLSCAACAVGNLIAANCGYKIIRVNGWLEWEGVSDANLVLWGKRLHELENLSPEESELVARYFRSTGYSENELLAIERAFEFWGVGEVVFLSDEDKMFNGLVAVLEILKEIHEVDDNEPEVTRFKNHYTTLVS